MPTFSRIRKYAIVGVGALSGAAFFYYNISNNGIGNKQQQSENSYGENAFKTEFTPSTKWDSNWDKRDPKSLTKPMKIRNEADENKYNEMQLANKPKAVRHILLIRHGQYNLAGTTDSERVLTDLGRQQAELTGKRLAELALPYSLIVRSTMSRAQETSKIIEKSLKDIPVVDDSILVEGSPIPPEPPFGHWTSENHYFQSSPRIEAAFRKYFHRALPQQEKDSYTVLVCHANVIRYFVCRALQFPPEAWSRFSLKNGSITWISIQPSGRVILRSFGDSGYMPPRCITTT